MTYLFLAVAFFLIYAFLADRSEHRKPYQRTKAQNDYLEWRKATKHIGREDWYAYRKAKKKAVKGWN